MTMTSGGNNYNFFRENQVPKFVQFKSSPMILRTDMCPMRPPAGAHDTTESALDKFRNPQP